VVFHPEFLREATAVYDFDNPPKIVAGEQTPGARPRSGDLRKIRFPKFTLKLTEAEMVKYYDNLFHA
jgi:GDP-mannose 6-dehydrogenase